MAAAAAFGVTGRVADVWCCILGVGWSVKWLWHSRWQHPCACSEHYSCLVPCRLGPAEVLEKGLTHSAESSNSTSVVVLPGHAVVPALTHMAQVFAPFPMAVAAVMTVAGMHRSALNSALPIPGPASAATVAVVRVGRVALYKDSYVMYRASLVVACRCSFLVCRPAGWSAKGCCLHCCCVQ